MMFRYSLIAAPFLSWLSIAEATEASYAFGESMGGTVRSNEQVEQGTHHLLTTLFFLRFAEDEKPVASRHCLPLVSNNPRVVS